MALNVNTQTVSTKSIQNASQKAKSGFLASCRRDFARNKLIYLMVLPVLLHYIVFQYFPMYGAQIAFRDFNALDGITGSPWVGLKHFTDFFGSFYFERLLKNTILLSVYGLIFTFPAPIILAVLLNEVRSSIFKRTVQTITYIPHFISIVVICGMIIDFVKQDGVITQLLTYIGFENTNLLLKPGNFRPIYIISDIWQQIGWNSIIYISAMAGVDAEMYEAADIDGAIARFRHATDLWEDSWRYFLYATDFCPPIELGQLDEYDYSIEKMFSPEHFDDIYYKNALRAFPRLSDYIKL